MSSEPGTEGADTRRRAIARLLAAAALLLFVLAALSDPAVVARFHFRQPLTSEAIEEAARSRSAFLAAGAAIGLPALLVALGLGPFAALGRRGPARVVIAALAALLPLFALDRGARPFVERRTSIFLRDAELGWRHRPSSRDTYWGARVAINSHGMRGPERAPDGPEPPGRPRRVLVLGDSVAFGLSIEDDLRTLPAQLEREIATRTGGAVECLNAAVCGWSPWQQERWLAREGERWSPDLVLLCFVLNDVTERFRLTRFGGEDEGLQLRYSRAEDAPRWVEESGLWLAARALRSRMETARERLDVYQLLLQPDSDPVQAAWKIVLPELSAILAWCRERSIPFALVVFPYSIQIPHPELDAPQWVLDRFAARRDLPFLDLLPALVGAADERGLREEDLFFDALHPTELGHEIAAGEIARFLLERGLLR